MGLFVNRMSSSGSVEGKAADQQWMEQWADSLLRIFDALETMARAGFSSIANALKQLDWSVTIQW